MSDDAPTDEALLRALAALAELPFTPQRTAELAPVYAAIRADHALIRLLPGELEPHTVFDPRWD